jgi:hypothetical protein
MEDWNLSKAIIMGLTLLFCEFEQSLHGQSIIVCFISYAVILGVDVADVRKFGFVSNFDV